MLINGNRYKIKGIKRRDFEQTTKGCMEAFLKGNKDYPFTIPVTEYYVKARMNGEYFDRTLVFTASEFKTLFPRYE